MSEIINEREIQLVVFKLGNEEFGVEISQVKEIVRLVPITPVPRSSDFVEGVINLRGQILAVIDLGKRLEIESGSRTDKSRIVVIEFGENTVGMIVDEVVEVLRLSEESIDKTPELIDSQVYHQYLEGVGKIGERLLILISLTKIFSPEEIENLMKTKEDVSKKKEETDE